MSGGPPHHPHSRQVPAAATPAWNHLQVPNYFPTRQPQHAHMSNDHSFMHQPTWHTPTTESMKTIPHSHLFSLEQMLSDRQFNRHAPGVDLSVTRNGSQNGDVPTSPISLSVRDTNKINSLPPSALDMHAVELTKCPSPGIKPLSPGVKPLSPSIIKPASPGIKPASPGLKPTSPGIIPVSSSVKPASPMKSLSPGLSTSVLACTGNITDSTKNTKRSNKRVDSILERLNPTLEKNISTLPSEPIVVPEKQTAVVTEAPEPTVEKKTETPPTTHSVIVQPPVTSHDESSNSSSIINASTPTNPKEEEVLSPCSNEDSLDSNKSRRKRKPLKTVRVSKEEEKIVDSDSDLTKTLEDSTADPKPSDLPDKELVESKIEDVIPQPENKWPERRASLDDVAKPAKTRRKTSSESETIDNIAAMVQEVIEEKKSKNTEEAKKEDIKREEQEKEVVTKPITVSVIKTKEHLQDTLTLEEKVPLILEHPKELLSAESPKDPPSVTEHPSPLVDELEDRPPAVEEPPVEEPPASPPRPPPSTILLTPAQKKATNTHFVEVENKLEEMFAGIEDNVDPLKTDHIDLGDDSKIEDDSLLKLDESMKLDDSVASTSHDVTSTSNETSISRTPQKKIAKKTKVTNAARRNADTVMETGMTKKSNKKAKLSEKHSQKSGSIKLKNKKPILSKQVSSKAEPAKDIYAYDSSSNTSSNKSKGPFIHIRGPRDSPISVNVVNTPINDDDPEKKPNKVKKYHDDSEYRHKVRTKGLHSSTLSNKYDAQTRDISWICAFCKRGPHGSDLNEPSQRNFDVALGDLFGPYFIGTATPEFERRLDDPYDKQFKSKKIAKMIDLTSQPIKVTGKKAKRKHSDSFDGRSSCSDSGDVYLGITSTGNETYEVWAHEDCIVWSPGVHLVGSKIIGLEEAVWTCCNVVCRKCNLKGANICCLDRGCTKVLHYCCAKGSDWDLDEVNFKAYCSIHKTGP